FTHSDVPLCWVISINRSKGTSECVNGVTDILGDADEYCDVEAIRTIGTRVSAFDLTSWIPRLYRQTLRECREEDLDPKDNLYKGPCVASRDFARGAWLDGLLEAQHSHTNPFQMGVIGSSDTHIGTGGNTAEATWPGHIVHETSLEGRLGAPGLGRHNRIEGNPGGLAGIWAVENSRDAIFQSMKRREAFATSGTRIAPRFFVGDYPEAICERDDWLEIAYARGVPMGANIPAPADTPTFVLQAVRDPSGEAQALKELQIIKGWVDDEGRKHSEVTTVVAADQPRGAPSFCQTYRDPDYDPSQNAYYYMRAVELPSIRWSRIQCDALDEVDKPPLCDQPMSDRIYEFAWTSPIWFEPEP
ncbi:MAG: DUF3604 domain-containing protein, partial [Pseudomonadota bacterium]